MKDSERCTCRWDLGCGPNQNCPIHGKRDDEDGGVQRSSDVAEPRSETDSDVFDGSKIQWAEIEAGLDHYVIAERVIWTEVDNAARTRRADPKRSTAAAILVMDSVVRAIAAKSLECRPDTPGPSVSERDVVERLRRTIALNVYAEQDGWEPSPKDHIRWQTFVVRVGKDMTDAISEIERLRKANKRERGFTEKLRELANKELTSAFNAEDKATKLRTALEAISEGWVEIDGGPREGMHGCIMRTIATEALKEKP